MKWGKNLDESGRETTRRIYTGANPKGKGETLRSLGLSPMGVGGGREKQPVRKMNVDWWRGLKCRGVDDDSRSWDILQKS